MQSNYVYTVTEVANILKVSTKTVYSLIHDREIDHVRVRGQIRIPSSAIEEYLKGGLIGEGTARNMV